MKIYQLTVRNKKVIFFKVKPALHNYYDFKGRLREHTEKSHLTFGNSDVHSKRHMGEICSWNVNYAGCEEIKEKNILIKNVEYYKTTFKNLKGVLLSKGQNILSHAELGKFNTFYDELIDVDSNSNIIIFRYKAPHETLFRIVILYKDIFLNLLDDPHINEINPESHNNIMKSFDFTPKDLKIETL